jgi:hypothetical protein
MFTPQWVVTKTLSNACAMKGGNRVEGSGHRAEKRSVCFDIIAFLLQCDARFTRISPWWPPGKARAKQGCSGNYCLSLADGPDKKCPSVGFGIQDSGIGTGDNTKEETKEMKRKRGIDRPMD